MDEYKVMGLAPYGDPGRHFDALMQFVRPREDGTYTIPLLYNNRTIEEKETYRGAIGQLVEALGPARQPGDPLTQHHMDAAAALQSVLEHRRSTY
jgi:carbamoyltransferase